MTFEKLDPQPAARDKALDDEARGAGLYAGETAYRLDDGHLVAVSVEQRWLDNNAGIAFTACARWIDADGATHLCAKGQHIEVNYPHVAPVAEIDAFGAGPIAGDVLRTVLGEPPALMREVPVDGAAPLQVPVIAIAEDARLNASIRTAVASAAGLAAFGDVDSLLASAAAPAKPAP